MKQIATLLLFAAMTTGCCNTPKSTQAQASEPEASTETATLATQKRDLTANGAWVEPNPIAPTQNQGFQLNADGTASSINMATLLCTKWVICGDSLTLTITSIGNKIESTSDESYQIARLDADSLILSQNSNPVWRLGHPAN